MSVQQPSDELWGGETRRPSRTSRCRASGCPWRSCAGSAASRAPPRAPTPSSGCSTPTSPSASPPPRDEIAAGRPRRAVPDRRLPDRLGHVVEHERQRGHRRPSPATGAHPNDHVNMGQSSNDVFPTRRAPRRARRGDQPAAARARAPRGGVRRQGRGVRRHRQVRPHAPDGRRARSRSARSSPATPRRSASARARVRNALPAGRADPARRHRDRHRPEHAPASSPRRCARRSRADTGLDDPRARGSRSRRRATATRSSSSPAR